MATLSFTTGVEAITLTESASTVERDRVVTCTTEAISFTEASAPINRTLHLNPASVEVLAFVENAAIVAVYEATIAQSFSGLTQTATADANHSTLLAEALAQGYPLENIFETLTDVGLLEDTFYAIIPQTYTDVFTATDLMIDDIFTVLHETATADGGYSSATYTTMLAETAKASDELVSVVTIILSDTINATDSQAIGTVTSLHETAYASDSTADSAVVANYTLSDTATAEGYGWPAPTTTFTETFFATNAITEWASPQETLVSVATGTEAITFNSTVPELLVAEALALDAMDFSGSVYNTTLHETAEGNGIPWAKDFGAAAWVLNTETGGLTNYDNFQFTSLTQLNGVVYGTTADGIYALTGENDEGRDIESVVQTGFLDFNRPFTKRVSDLYVGYTGGQLDCTVETYDGPQEEYTYTLEERDADAPRNNRMKVGKGLSSRYWRFTFENVAGADFQIYDAAANVAESKRRL